MLSERTTLGNPQVLEIAPLDKKKTPQTDLLAWQSGWMN